MSSAKDEIVELTVERIGARGDGVAQHAGKPVYLAFAAPGDRVRARLGAARDEGRLGTVVEIRVPGARGRPQPARISGPAAVARSSISPTMPIAT